MERRPGETGERAVAGGASGRVHALSADELADVERTHPGGLTSKQIVDVFTARGIRFSEATLRKYVQLGLLPRSVRVGRKGKHRGSCGLYPAHVVRRVNAVKEMMARDLTIDDIKRSFARFQEDIDAVERSLRDLVSGLERELPGAAPEGPRRAELERDLGEAKKAASSLIRRIADLERRMTEEAQASRRAPTPGGGDDLF